MSKPQTKKRLQLKEARLEIVAGLYKRGYSLRAIREEVMRRLALPTLSLYTVQRDVKTLLAEWRETRIENLDEALQLELERIDEAVRELWEQWERSKAEQSRTATTRRGAPLRGGGIETVSVQDSRTDVAGLGNPSYIAEIRQQLAERRKLLGLYAPEARQIKGEVTVLRSPSEMTAEEIEAEIRALKLNE